MMARDRRKQQGVALIVSLLFLLVLTLISIAAARNGAFSVKMASNMQDMNNSFQSAEAGAMAVLSLAGDPNQPDPFNLPLGTGADYPMSGALATTYLGNVRNGPESVGVRVGVVGRNRSCPRATDNMQGNSFGQRECTFYRVQSEHNEDGRSRTRVQLGVVKTTIK